jgi:hypothetical protein
MNALVRVALRNGWRRGVLQGSRPWMIAGGVAAAYRLVRRLATRREQVVYREELLPGESLVIAHERPA